VLPISCCHVLVDSKEILICEKMITPQYHNSHRTHSCFIHRSQCSSTLPAISCGPSLCV
jgi:hypothetical protein